MQVTLENVDVRTVKVLVECEPKQVQDGFKNAYKVLAKQVKVPGFRPGQAPRAVLEKMLDSKTVRDEASEQIVKLTFSNAIKENDITVEPTVRPNVDVKELDETSGTCKYEANVSLIPVVELGKYEGLTYEKQAVDVTEEDVEKQIESLRRQRATPSAVTERGAETGDMAVVNIKLEGADSQGKTFMTAVGKTFPQLDELLLGMRTEQIKSAELEFPKNFSDKDWAGKTHKCIISVNSLSSVNLPALDADFASALQFDSVEQLQTRVKELLTSAREEAARELINEQILDALLEKSKVEVPPAMADQLAYRRLRETEMELHEKGQNLQQFAEENGMTLEELIKEWQEKAKVHVARALLIRDVFKAENMKIEQQDVADELQSMAKEYQKDPKEMYELLVRNQSVEELHFRAITRKVSDFLYEKAKGK